MIYMLALLLLMYSGLFAELRRMSKVIAAGDRKAVGYAPVFLLLGAMMAGLPVAEAILTAGGGAIHSALFDMRVAVILSLCGASICLASYGLRLEALRRQAQKGPIAHRAMGPAVLGFLAALLVAYTCVDQLLYFRNPNSGVVNVEMLRQMKLAEDVDCARDVVLVRDIESETVEYRCPKTIVLGMWSNLPFAPWPDYTEGTSVKLAGEMRELVRNSEQLVPSPAASSAN